MKGKKKITVLILGAICSIVLVGGSVFARESKSIQDSKEPVAFAKGDGASYSREELAEKSKITLKVFDEQMKTYEFPLSDTTTISGKVEEGVPIQ